VPLLRNYSIIAPVIFHVLAVGNRIQQAQRVDSILRIKAVNQDGVGGAIFSNQLQLGIINDDVTIVCDAQLASDLQYDLRFVLARLHVSSGFAAKAPPNTKDC
jgi:hypothetical protein